MDSGFTPKQFVNLFTADKADRQIEQLFTHEFGNLCETPRGGECCTASYKYLGHLESKERLRIQPAQLFHFS